MRVLAPGMSKTLWGLGALLTSIAVTAPATADDAAPERKGADKADVGNDEVTLKNGGLVRGTVVSVEPGTKVVILELGAKEPRTIPWAEVADVERNKHAAPPSSGPGKAGPGYEHDDENDTDDDDDADEAPAKTKRGSRGPRRRELGEPGVVRLHVESPEPVKIFQNRIVGSGYVGGYRFVAGTSDFICDAPCGEVVDARYGDRFRLVGEMPPTNFDLEGLSGDVTVHVKPGSRGLKIGGIVMTAVGGAAILAGASVLIYGATLDAANLDLDGTVDTDDGSDYMIPGAVTMGVGAAVLVGGIVSIVVARTSTDVQPGSPDRAARAPRAPRYWLGEF
jgi:hypothetical protein